MRDTFHQTAVTHEHISEVVNDVVTRFVELRCQSFLSNRHTYGISDALAEWASGGFDARCVTVFWVTRCFRMQLTEVFQIVNRQLIAAQVQQRVNQHRAVAVRQHKAVAVSPIWVLWVVV